MLTSSFPHRASAVASRASLRAGLAAIVLVTAACAAAGGGSSAPASAPAAAPRTVTRKAGAVATAESDATRAGLEVLKDGGDAADAAVASALTLAVVHPQAGNIGGGGFAVVRLRGEVAALDFRETGPAGARQDMYLGSDGSPVPDASLVGPLAAGVPGSPAGLFELHRRFGRLPWRRVVEPALRLARDGFIVSARLHHAIEAEAETLDRFPESAAVWRPGGESLPAGARLRLPALAETLEAYAEEGPRAITSGPLAAAIESASRRHGGILTAGDLAAYRPVWREPLRFAAFGWDLASMPLPASGGIIVAQSSMMLERLGWAALPRGGIERAHLLVEAWRRAYADRYLLGDPATSRADAASLLAPDYVARRAAGIDPRRATASDDVRPWPDRGAAESSETTHLSVVDGDGGVASLTTTLNGWFGCGLLVPEAGFFLNNEMDDFATAPGRPNLFELIQGQANAVRPGARMLSSMAPMIAWRGTEVMAIGARGGSLIPTSAMQVLLAIAIDGAGLQEAIDAPRLHHQWQPDLVRYEAGALDAASAAEMQARGYALKPALALGEVEAVRARGDDGRFEAAADRRGPGSAMTDGGDP